MKSSSEEHLRKGSESDGKRDMPPSQQTQHKFNVIGRPSPEVGEPREESARLERTLSDLETRLWRQREGKVQAEIDQMKRNVGVVAEASNRKLGDRAKETERGQDEVDGRPDLWIQKGMYSLQFLAKVSKREKRNPFQKRWDKVPKIGGNTSKKQYYKGIYKEN